MQCEAKTKNGEPCKAEAISGEDFCGNHMRIPVPVKESLHGIEATTTELGKRIEQLESDHRAVQKKAFSQGVGASVVASVIFSALVWVKGFIVRFFSDNEYRLNVLGMLLYVLIYIFLAAAITQSVLHSCSITE